jgi:hypothetical protein
MMARQAFSAASYKPSSMAPPATATPRASAARVNDLIPPGGQLLDHHVRAPLESRLGFDFSRVQIHSNDIAARMARSVDAQAYTLGEHIVFGAGRFAPGTNAGRRLLAHELVHVAQCGSLTASSSDTAKIGDLHDPTENEADAVAAHITNGGAGAPLAPWTAGIKPSQSGPTLRRVPVGSNSFGSWDVEQVPMQPTVAGGEYHNRIRIQFDPDPKTVDSPEIAFVQATSIQDKGSGAWALPGDFPLSRRVSGRGWSVDSMTKRGLAGYDDAGHPGSADRPGGLSSAPIVIPGSSPSPLQSAVTHDWPGWATPNLSWTFNTAAVAKRGADKGTVYGTVTWGFVVDGANHIDTLPVNLHAAPGPAWKSATEAWNKQAKGPAASRAAPDQQTLPEFKFAP